MQFHTSGFLQQIDDPAYQNKMAQAQGAVFGGIAPQQPPKPMFDELCSKRLSKTIAVCDERGAQYGDTLKDCQWLVVRSVIKKLAALGYDLTDPRAARMIAIAGLVDIKYQRFQGGYKEDNLDDGINYSAVLAELMKDAV